jgi:hypothetical protein
LAGATLRHGDCFPGQTGSRFLPTMMISEQTSGGRHVISRQTEEGEHEYRD